MGGKQGGKKGKCSSGIACGGKPDFVSYIKGLVGAGNVRKYRQSGYTIHNSKIHTIDLLERVGPYMINQRDKIKEFENYCNLNVHESAATMKQVEFVMPDPQSSKITVKQMIRVY